MKQSEYKHALRRSEAIADIPFQIMSLAMRLENTQRIRESGVSRESIAAIDRALASITGDCHTAASAIAQTATELRQLAERFRHVAENLSKATDMAYEAEREEQRNKKKK